MAAGVYIISATYIAAVCALLYVARRRRLWYAHAKGVCSALFVLACIYAWVLGKQAHPVHFFLLLAALALCAVGDVMLGVANRKGKATIAGNRRFFKVGVLAFSVAHCLFCAYFYSMLPLGWYDFLLPAALLLALYMLERKGQVALKAFRPLGYAYTFLVGLMAAKAVEMAVFHIPSGVLSLVGGTLFLISDVVLLFLYFGTHRPKWIRAANLTTYYSGVFLLAWCGFWL